MLLELIKGLLMKHFKPNQVRNFDDIMNFGFPDDACFDSYERLAEGRGRTLAPYCDMRLQL